MKFSAHWTVPGSKEGIEWRRMGQGMLASPFTARFEFEDDHTVELDIAVEAETPVCEAIRIQRNPARPSLTGAELRRLPLRNWITMATTQAAVTPSGEQKGAWGPATEKETEQLWGEVQERVRRRTITDDFLGEVAAVYRNNLDNHPRDAVADHFTVSLSTAARYVKLARERGLLGKAPGPGKSGER
jgi:hypothetical protein